MRAVFSALWKYSAATLCGLLLVAWLASQFIWVSAHRRLGTGVIEVTLTHGMFVGTYIRPARAVAGGFHFGFGKEDSTTLRLILGRLTYQDSSPPDHWLNTARFRQAIQIPIPFLLIILLPLAVGPLVRYRFPLWSWLAYLTLLCGALAFYCAG